MPNVSQHVHRHSPVGVSLGCEFLTLPCCSKAIANLVLRPGPSVTSCVLMSVRASSITYGVNHTQAARNKLSLVQLSNLQSVFQLVFVQYGGSAYRVWLLRG